MTPRTARRVAALLSPALLLATTCCGTSVEISSPDLPTEQRTACEALVEDLPDELFGQERVEVSGDGVGAAWGDPAVVLTCGSAEPDSFDAWSRCSEIEGVGWYIPDAQMKDLEGDLTLWAQSHEPRVRLDIPAEHRYDGPDTHLATLGAVIDEHLEEVHPCT